MQKFPFATDHRRLRLSRILQPEFRPLLGLLYWPIFGFLFYYVERLRPVEHYYEVYIPLDDYIPFLEIFLLPYLFWFVFLFGIHLYTVFFDLRAYRGLIRFVIISYSIALVIFFLWPTVQNLRPDVLPRDNFLSRFMAAFYQFDTNTNVCPSLHVVGSAAVWCTSWHIPRFRTPGWRVFFTVSTILISFATVFLKQHSLIDVIVAVPVCTVSYLLSFGRFGLRYRIAKPPIKS
ncbi:MAG: phosphatase PAP2 family protein [Ruminococcaceae bacterium]|nr:phosphatase PAP2 family protein [Oscillospiraceae bacterium]